MHAWGLRPRGDVPPLAVSSRRPVLPSPSDHEVGPPDLSVVSRLHTQPASPPANASPPPLPATVHGVRPGWVAGPSP